MDKKKVEELIEQAIIWSRYANQHSVISNLEEALKELNKPEPKYRPFAKAEECWQEMMKHQPFGWVKMKCTESKYYMLKCIGSRVVIGLDETHFSYKKVFEDYVFADGTPFGVKDE